MAQEYDMAITLDKAKEYITELLEMHNDPDHISAILKIAQDKGSQYTGWTVAHDETYAMYRLALADITGDAKYRS